MDKHQRLRWARERAGYSSASEAASAFGWKVPTYIGHENGSRGFSAETAASYGRALRVPAEWILFGGNLKERQEDDGLATLPSEDEAFVPVYDVAASAGHGVLVESEEVICNMAFDRRFLRRMTDARPNELAIIRVKGHSMEPTLLDDDHVLVDRTKRNLSYDGLFVIRFDDALHVKRIGRSATRGNVLVISDHSAYRDLDMPKENLDVIGRVLWVGRKV